MGYVKGLGGGGGKFGGRQNVAAATPTAKGVASWTVTEFKRALTEGVFRDGRKLNPPMVDFSRYYQTITHDRINAMCTYIKSLNPVDMFNTPQTRHPVAQLLTAPSRRPTGRRV